LGIQIILSVLDSVLKNNLRMLNHKDLNKNKIGIVYPIYNEKKEVLERVLKTALKVEKNLPTIKILFLDDGSTNYDDVKPIYDKYKKLFKNAEFISKKNEGKRHTQKFGFDILKDYKYIITVDSDTLINSDAIINSISKLENDNTIGAITGDIKVENKGTNFLTTLISLRYWLAFNLERQAQNFSDSVLCCSGPFTVYRNNILQNMKDKYINQTFLGNIATYGDDRHLTNLVFSQGYKVKYNSEAIAYTYVPENLDSYFNQQTRWNKSFFREIIWSMKYSKNISIYSLFDMYSQLIIFILFSFAISATIFNYLQSGDIYTFIYYISLVLLMGFIRSLYAIIRTFNFKFILFSIYGFIHILFLVPIRLKALLTLNDTNWGTRSTKNSSNVWGWMAIYFVGVLIFSVLLFLASGSEKIYLLPSLDYSFDYILFIKQTLNNWSILMSNIIVGVGIFIILKQFKM